MTVRLETSPAHMPTEPRRTGETVRHPAVVLTATILASSLSFIDGSVVNVGLPAIGGALQGDAAALQWVIAAGAAFAAALCGLTTEVVTVPQTEPTGAEKQI